MAGNGAVMVAYGTKPVSVDSTISTIRLFSEARLGFQTVQFSFNTAPRHLIYLVLTTMTIFFCFRSFCLFAQMQSHDHFGAVTSLPISEIWITSIWLDKQNKQKDVKVPSD